MLFPLAATAALFAASTTLASPFAASTPLETRDTACRGISGPFLGSSFPDPTLTNEDGTWYTFGTGNGKDFQAAKSTDFGKTWERSRKKTVLAVRNATWAGQNEGGSSSMWAPDVMRRTDGKYVMYFAATDKQKKSQHCIGAGISDTIDGTYQPVNSFHQCNRTAHGAIDPAWFKDSDGKQYVVYKTEIPTNYLELREVSHSGTSEGVKWTSPAKKLLAVNGQGFDDGNNLEAPYLFKRAGVYFLTYSTHITMDGSYDVQYATATNVWGPYKRVKEPLLKSGSQYGCKLIGPGGASFQRFKSKGNEDTRIIFHGLTEDMNINRRVVYTAKVKVKGHKLSIPTVKK